MSVSSINLDGAFLNDIVKSQARIEGKLDSVISRQSELTEWTNNLENKIQLMEIKISDYDEIKNKQKRIRDRVDKIEMRVYVMVAILVTLSSNWTEVLKVFL